MKTNEEIIEEFLSHFPTKEQVIKNFESDGTSTWNFTEHFKSVLLEVLQAKDEQARIEKIDLMESLGVKSGYCIRCGVDRLEMLEYGSYIACEVYGKNYGRHAFLKGKA